MRIHIDGDILVYRCGFAAEKGEYILTYMGEHGDELEEAYTYKKDLDRRIRNLGLRGDSFSVDFSRRAEPVGNAFHNVKTTIRKITEVLCSDDVVVYLSGPDNYRYEIATIRPYKGNRDPEHKPLHGPALKDFIKKTWPTVVSNGEEADDVIGIEHTKMRLQDDLSSVVASTDKDLDMIPGLHFNFVKQETYYVDEQEAMKRFYMQLLTGDTVDNIVGVPGIGPKKAAELLDGIDDELYMYKVVRDTYDNDEALLENARLLWIRRKEGELWEPPQQT